MRRKIVIALGGNALGSNVDEQRKAVDSTAKVIVDLAAMDADIIITHGNGPQVGMIQRAMDGLALREPDYRPVTLPFSVAMSQGYIGIDLQNAIKYELLCRGMDRKVSTILSQIEVDPSDPAFENPTKPIGYFMTKEEARKLEQEGQQCREDAGRGWRIVVPSPKPMRIRELATIKTLVAAGHIVITCGGGGIPVVSENGRLVGVSAVIDKDRTSSLLAAKLEADDLLILTAVEKVAVNFGKKDQRWLDTLTIEEAQRYIKEGQFAKGSMLPKVEAAAAFAGSGPGRQALITSLERAKDAVRGLTGTRITAQEKQ